ncbi:MAG TPA: hypothetical protein VKO42_00835 [Patescibacteria group bacterium]|nr:hypothetical protein [Patescibacteria group bacterium]
MLTRLFGSRARVRLLKLFLFNPDQRFYIRQIARNLDLQVNSVRRELENLKSFGLLAVGGKVGGKEEASAGEESEKKSGQEKYYYVNKDFVLFGELRSLIAKAQVLYKKDFMDNIKKVGSPQLVVLTGLFVDNDKAPVDLLIVGKVEKKKVKTVIGKLEKELGTELNFTILSSAEFKYRRDITDVFLYNILETRNIILIDKIGVTAEPEE